MSTVAGLCRHCGEPIVDLNDNDGFGRPRFQHTAADDGLPYNYCTSPGTNENPGIKYHLAWPSGSWGGAHLGLNA